MKLLASILSIATVNAGWQQKWEERFGKGTETKRNEERTAVCDARAEEEIAKFPITGGSWDCPLLGEDVANIFCNPTCDSPTDRGNWGKRSFIKVQCRNSPTVRLRNVSNNMKCEPDICLTNAEDFTIPKGTLSKVRRNSRKTLFNVTCDDLPGSQASVLCDNTSGVFTSKVNDWQNVCDPVCIAEEAADFFPIGNGEWNCNSKMKCVANCFHEESDPVRFRINCQNNAGEPDWRIFRGQKFANDVCTDPGTTTTSTTTTTTTTTTTSTTTPEAPTTTTTTTRTTTSTRPETTEPPATEFAPLSDAIKSGLSTCVSDSNFPTGGRKKREKLSKIVGGVNADEGSWPWITRLFLTTTVGGGSGFLCGGSIVHNNWVLTAAHCCEGIAEVVATFGDISRSSFESGQFSLSSTTMFNHPEWNQGADGDFGNSDWCLVKFDQDILAVAPEPEKVKIACLPSEPIAHGSGCWVAGWGTTSSGGSTSSTLLSAGVNILGKEYCENFSNNGFLMPDDICAGLPDTDGNGLTDPGKDACQGDSGGPLICPVDGKAVLAGVVSRGVGCASEGFPGLYSATWNAKDWMRDIVLNN